jgi:hypothetical protein
MYSQQQLDQALATLRLATQRTETLTQMAPDCINASSGQFVDVQAQVGVAEAQSSFVPFSTCVNQAD